MVTVDELIKELKDIATEHGGELRVSLMDGDDVVVEVTDDSDGDTCVVIS